MEILGICGENSTIILLYHLHELGQNKSRFIRSNNINSSNHSYNTIQPLVYISPTCRAHLFLCPVIFEAHIFSSTGWVWKVFQA